MLLIAALCSLWVWSTNSGPKGCKSFADIQEGEEVTLAVSLAEPKAVCYYPEPDSNSFLFFVTDKAGTVHRVIMKRPMPDGFEQARNVVIIGSRKGNDFIATDLRIKCHAVYNTGRSSAI